MRRVILQEFISIDGFAADAAGSTQFFENLSGENEEQTNKDKAVDEDLLSFIHSIDTILLGANTYKMFVEFWPRATTDEEPVADALNETPKIVFSETLKEAPWGKWEPAKVVGTDAAAEIKRLKKQPGKDMVIWGSLSLAQALLKEHVIDEVQLRVCPVALGAGKKFFPEEGWIHLKHTGTKTCKDGVVLLTYKAK